SASCLRRSMPSSPRVPERVRRSPVPGQEPATGDKRASCSKNFAVLRQEPGFLGEQPCKGDVSPQPVPDQSPAVHAGIAPPLKARSAVGGFWALLLQRRDTQRPPRAAVIDDALPNSADLVSDLIGASEGGIGRSEMNADVAFWR